MINGIGVFWVVGSGDNNGVRSHFARHWNALPVRIDSISNRGVGVDGLGLFDLQSALVAVVALYNGIGRRQTGIPSTHRQ